MMLGIRVKFGCPKATVDAAAGGTGWRARPALNQEPADIATTGRGPWSAVVSRPANSATVRAWVRVVESACGAPSASFF